MLRNIQTLQDAVDWGLCIGCGACHAACDRGAIALVNIEHVGIRPRIADSCAKCSACLSICPGYQVDGQLATGPIDPSDEAQHEFGAALEIWEGYAADPEIRHKASSGGLLTALALYCLERKGMEFVVHAGMDDERPWVNKTVQSRTRAELLSRTGSRYSPASPAEGLRDIENSAGPCVFIGKPCDTAAAFMMRRQRPDLDRKLGLVLTFFCAGTPSSQGTIDLIRSLAVEPQDATSIRYRGEGWPGRFRVTAKGNETDDKSYSYMESWGRLTRYRSFRCNICPDGLGRVADISCGDAWNEFQEGSSDPGRSLVLVRTEHGRKILQGARAAGYVQLRPVGSAAVLKAQENLLQRRREIFGRILAMRLLWIPRPRFQGFSLWRSWSRLALGTKMRTVLGTGRRLLQRGLWQRKPLF